MKAYPDELREKALTLRGRGWSYGEIAKVVKVSVPAIGTWVRYAILKHPRKNKHLGFASRPGRKPLKAAA